MLEVLQFDKSRSCSTPICATAAEFYQESRCIYGKPTQQLPRSAIKNLTNTYQPGSANKARRAALTQTIDPANQSISPGYEAKRQPNKRAYTRLNSVTV